MATPLSAILADAKDIADMVGNTIVGDPTWRRWINQGQERLYRLLVTKSPARFQSSITSTITGNTILLTGLGFRQLREGGVTRDPGSQSMRRTLRRFNFGERDAQGRLPAWGAGRELAYDIQNNTQIVIEPASLAPGTYGVYFLVGPTAFATDGSGDSVNISTVFEPYVDFIATWAAIKGLMKDESLETAAELRRDLAVLADEIQAEFSESSDPATIIDVDQVGGTNWP